MKRLPLLTVAIVAALTACDSSQTPQKPDSALPPGAQIAAEVITTDQLLEDVSRLGGDAMEGRGPGSPGDERARAYLAERLGEIGFEPAFEDKNWEQPFEIVGITAEMPQQWVFNAADGEKAAFSFGDQYVGASGVQQKSVEIKDAEVVFVGYGIESTEEDWNDFKGIDLSGKILLMLNDDPDWDPELFAGERRLYTGRWSYKFESAARQHAAGAIIIHTTHSAGYPWGVVHTGWTGEQFELPAGDEERTLLNAWMTEDSARRLLQLSGHDLDALMESAKSREFEPLPLDTTTSISFTTEMRSTTTANVGGVLRGSDPVLAEEYVVISAHHDHFGFGAPDDTGDTIYNGALDNGVAMAEALAVAEAFGALPDHPRRSIMILFVAVEEQGILGSLHFVRSGAVHPGRIAANINCEMGNVWGPTKDVMIFGKGKSELDDLLEPLAQSQDRVLVGESDVRSGWYYRSDHFRFAQAGVPAIWFKSGIDFIGRPEGWGQEQYRSWIENHYHRPSDEVEDSWNLAGLEEDAELAFMLADVVANRDEMPKWVPGDEFEDERIASFEDLKQRQ